MADNPNDFTLRKTQRLAGATPAELENFNYNWWLIENALRGLGATNPGAPPPLSIPVRHDQLQELNDDDHLQYFYLPGRTAAALNAFGSTANNATLTIRASTQPNSGLLTSRVVIGGQVDYGLAWLEQKARLFVGVNPDSAEVASNNMRLHIAHSAQGTGGIVFWNVTNPIGDSDRRASIGPTGVSNEFGLYARVGWVISGPSTAAEPFCTNVTHWCRTTTQASGVYVGGFQIYGANATPGNGCLMGIRALPSGGGFTGDMLRIFVSNSLSLGAAFDYNGCLRIESPVVSQDGNVMINLRPNSTAGANPTILVTNQNTGLEQFYVSLYGGGTVKIGDGAIIFQKTPLANGYLGKFDLTKSGNNNKVGIGIKRYNGQQTNLLEFLTHADILLSSVDKDGKWVGPISPSGFTTSFKDTEFELYDNVDATKKAVFQLSNITTNTTRTFTFPDIDGTLVVPGQAYTWVGIQTHSAKMIHNGDVDLNAIMIVDGTNGGSVQQKVNNAGIDTALYLYDGSGNDYAIQVPAFSGNIILGLPAAGGTVVTTSATQNISGKSLTNGGIGLVNQINSIGATNIPQSGSTNAGLYEVEVYAICTAQSAVACTLDVTIGWNDGTARTLACTANDPAGLWTLDMTGANYAMSRFVVYRNSGNITYATTVTGGDGNQRYSLYIRILRIAAN